MIRMKSAPTAMTNPESRAFARRPAFLFGQQNASARLCVLSAALLLTAPLAGCSRDEFSAPNAALQNEPPQSVEVLHPSLISETITALGTVVPDHRIEAASRLSAYIESLPKKEGDLVKAGDVVLKLDPKDVEAAIRAASAKVSVAQAAEKDAALDREKFSSLYKEGLVSNNDWRKVSLKYEAARSDLKEAQALLAMVNAQLAYATVSSPIDGRVAKVLKREGDLAVPGLPVIVIDSEANPKVEMSVPQNQRAAIRPGSTVLVSLEGEAEKLEGTVERMTESADRISRTTLARIAFSGEERRKAEKRLSPGMYVRVEAQIEHAEEASGAPALWLPESALATRGGLEGAFVLEDGKAKFRWLRTGKRANGMVQVLAGLEDLGSKASVINAPAETLRDGSPAKARASLSSREAQ